MGVVGGVGGSGGGGGGVGERIGYEACVLTFFTVLSEIFLIIRIIRYDIAINVY